MKPRHVLSVENHNANLCASGKHCWSDPEDRKRCCNGYVRVMGGNRQELEAEGAEHIVLRQTWLGWQKEGKS